MRLVFGKHSVLDLLEAQPTPLTRVVMHKGAQKGDRDKVEALAREAGLKVEYVSESWFGQNCREGRHQGLAAYAPDYRYADLFTLLKKAPEQAMLLVLDQVNDPHNLGAILRSAEALGALAVVIPKDRACDVTPTVEKISSGAAGRVNVCQETNLSQALAEAKQAGFWCYGLSLEGKDLLEDEDLPARTCLVLGSEAKGIRPLVAKNCDKLVRIAMRGKTQSLNVSVAAGIALHTTARKIFAK